MDAFISPLFVNGLRGRVLHMPGPKHHSPEVLFVYGHHSSIERWQGVAELMAQYAAVTMPDLPGFGGMDSLYRIGKLATLDNLADYLANFIAEYYPASKRFSIVGMSLGFVVVTRMLQRHPDIATRITTCISLFGFAHKDDFILPLKRRRFGLRVAKLFSRPGFASAYRAVLLNRFVLSRAYHRTPNAREKFKNATTEEHAANMDFEIKLWQNSDLRTYMQTTAEFLQLDNTLAQINLPVYHVAVAKDRFFDNKTVEKHYARIFTNVIALAELQSANHAPTRIKTAAEAEAFIPPELLKKIAAAATNK